MSDQFMSILLLHPEDDLAGSSRHSRWDMVVDLGRAPKSLYDEWATRFGCPAFSIFELAREIEDFRSWRGIMDLGRGYLLDSSGIDWWDLIGMLMQPEVQDVRLALRLAEKIRGTHEIVTSRPSLVAAAVGLHLGIPVREIHPGRQRRLKQQFGRYGRALSNLKFDQLRQVAFDKYDPTYKWRRRIARPARLSTDPVILLPTAYSNVTRTALSYAELLPEQQFLLVIARESAAPSAVPQNVEAASLAAFAKDSSDAQELRGLENQWTEMERALNTHPDYKVACELGVLTRGRKWLRWGLAVRDAWARVFETQAVVGCLSADDSNPYTRVPLLLALKRDLPAVACHHGALDARMMYKGHQFSTYLAKGGMEKDYLERVCLVDREKIRIGAARVDPDGVALWDRNAPWIVVFTEPYESDGWRGESVYRDILSRVVEVARRMEKIVVVKIHPFESGRQRRRMLKHMLSGADLELVRIEEGALSRSIFEKAWCAVTVESTTAFECAALGIPVFLCGWLRHAYVAYAAQYARYGVGMILDSADDLLRIPENLPAATPAAHVSQHLMQPITATALAEVLCGPVVGRLR